MWCDDFWIVVQSGDCFCICADSNTITWWEKWLTTITSHDRFNFPIMFVCGLPVVLITQSSRISPEFHQILSGIFAWCHRISKDFTGISLGFRRNFAGIFELKHLKKGDSHNSAFPHRLSMETKKRDRHPKCQKAPYIGNTQAHPTPSTAIFHTVLRIVRPRIFESKFRNRCAKKLDGALRKSTSV